MEFTTYWSILDTPANSIKSNTIALIVFVAGSLLWLLAKKYKKDNGDGDRKIVLFGTALFSILGLLMYIVMTFIYKDNSQQLITEMLNSSKTKKVEGFIFNFERTYRNHRAGRETTESFTVDNFKFSYSDALLGKFGAFGKTYNDVIHNGQYVRVTFNYDSTFKNDSYYKMLKLEIGKTK